MTVMVYLIVNYCLHEVNFNLPSVLWRCWLGGRKGIWLVKKLSGGVLAWLSVSSEMQTCIWPSWCHCHSLSLASVKSRLILPFWYQLTRLVPKRAVKRVCVYLKLISKLFCCLKTIFFSFAVTSCNLILICNSWVVVPGCHWSSCPWIDIPLPLLLSAVSHLNQFQLILFLLFVWCGMLRHGHSVDNTVEENSSVFSLIRIRWLPSARACGQ